MANRDSGGGNKTPEQSWLPYRNPFRDATLTPARVDQGVDYTAQPGQPIYALGPGQIVQVENPGWPGGTFIAERLTGGVARGKYVYAAENITPEVHVGQKVTSATVIGRFAPGSIETGWAAPPPDVGQALAGEAGQASPKGDPGDVSTAYGADYSGLLAALGAVPGIVQGKLSGSIPANWPVPLMRGKGDAASEGTGPLPAGGSDVGRVVSGVISDLDLPAQWGSDVLGGGSDIAKALLGVAAPFTKVAEGLDWLFHPNHWVRIGAGASGLVLLGLGLWNISNTGRNVQGPQALPLGILLTGVAGILLFVAFHNLPDSVTDFPGMLGYLSDEIHAGSTSGGAS